MNARTKHKLKRSALLSLCHILMSAMYARGIVAGVVILSSALVASPIEAQDLSSAYSRAQSAVSDFKSHVGSRSSSNGRSERSSGGSSSGGGSGSSGGYYSAPDESTINRATTLYQQRNYQAAEQEYRKAAILNPKNPRGHLGLSLTLVFQGRYVEALPEIREALRLDPSHQDWWQFLSDCLNNAGLQLEQQGRWAEAESAYREAIQRGNNNAHQNLSRMLIDESKSLISEGRWNEAEAAAREATRLGNRDVESILTATLYLKGTELQKRGQLDQAAAAWRMSMRLGDMYAADALGKILSQQHRWDDAEAAYREAIRRGNEFAPHSLSVMLIAKAHELEKHGHLGEAEAAYLEASNLGEKSALPALADISNKRGVDLANKGDYVAAEKAYRQAIKQNPSNGILWNNLALALGEQRRWAEAEAAYRQGIGHHNKDSEQNLSIMFVSEGLDLAQQRRWDDAEKAYREALRRGNAHAQWHLAEMFSDKGYELEQKGEFEKAAAVYGTAATLNPSLGNALQVNRARSKADVQQELRTLTSIFGSQADLTPTSTEIARREEINRTKHELLLARKYSAIGKTPPVPPPQKTVTLAGGVKVALSNEAGWFMYYADKELQALPKPTRDEIRHAIINYVSEHAIRSETVQKVWNINFRAARDANALFDAIREDLATRGELGPAVAQAIETLDNNVRSQIFGESDIGAQAAETAKGVATDAVRESAHDMFYPEAAKE